MRSVPQRNNNLAVHSYCIVFLNVLWSVIVQLSDAVRRSWTKSKFWIFRLSMLFVLQLCCFMNSNNVVDFIWFWVSFQSFHLIICYRCYKRFVKTDWLIYSLPGSISKEIETHRFIDNVDIPLLLKRRHAKSTRSGKNNLLKFKYVSRYCFFMQSRKLSFH